MSQNFALGLRLLPQLSQKTICGSSGVFCKVEVVSRVKSVCVLMIVLCCGMIFLGSSTGIGTEASDVSAILGRAGVSSFLGTLGFEGDPGCSP